MRIWAKLVVCVICLSFVSTVSAQMKRRVTAIGKAAGAGIKASDEAKMDAKRNAVEQACGLYINAMSQTENFQLVKDRILGQAAGYISEYKVNREWADEGISYCEITAVVSTADFERDWQKFAHLKEDEKNPRMMVVLVEDNDVDDLKEPVVNGICQSKLENFFLSKDVQLVDKSVSEDVRVRDVSLAALNNDVVKLAAVAAAFKAEVLVFGRAEAKCGSPISLGGRTLYRWDVTLNVRAVQADSAAILMSNTYRPKKPYMTTSAAAGDDAFDKLAQDTAEQVLKDIGRAWHKRATSRRILETRFSPVSRKQAKAIMAALAEHRGVVRGREGLKIRNLSQGVADIEVDWKFDLNLLADTIEELKVEGMGFEVTEQTGNRIDVKVIARE
ncbi:MAG: hypothetical protein KAV82_00460 [Phycisphaerae bacterium]|nr:hypothetical protein [Phycisphaerae bacterium]